MWEGQAISRPLQRIAGGMLAVVSLPFMAIGTWALWAGIIRAEATFAIVATASTAILFGLYGLTIAYRIFFGKGVRQGGGVMSPLAFRIGGFALLIFAAFLSYEAIMEGKPESGAGVFVALFLALIFFVAARHRGAMRSIK